MTEFWATEYTKLAAGYKALLRDSTNAYNSFLASRGSTPIRTVPAPIVPNRFAASRSVANPNAGLAERFPASTAPEGPYALPVALRGKPMMGVELRDPDDVLKHGLGFGRRSDAMSVIGHELTHAHQSAAVNGGTPTSSITPHSVASAEQSDYDRSTNPGLFHRVVAAPIARVIPRITTLAPVLSRTAPRLDVSAHLRNTGQNQESQADFVGSDFADHLKSTNPELHDSILRRWNLETSKAKARSSAADWDYEHATTRKPGVYERLNKLTAAERADVVKAVRRHD